MLLKNHKALEIFILVISISSRVAIASSQANISPTLYEAFEQWETPVEAMYERRHAAIPEIDLIHWTLVIDGLVENPLTLKFSDLNKFPFHRIHSVLSCSGLRFQNAWLAGNVEWGGVLIGDLIKAAKPKPEARWIHFVGLDSSTDLINPGYTQSIPLGSLVPNEDLIAFEMNRQVLPKKHGAPARVVLPGRQGFKWVKWITRITISKAESSASILLWNHLEGLHSLRKNTREKIERVPPSVIISLPRLGSKLSVGAREFRGYAFSGTGIINSVEYSVDDGKNWLLAKLALPEKKGGWQFYSASQNILSKGVWSLSFRITDSNGNVRSYLGNSAFSFKVE